MDTHPLFVTLIGVLLTAILGGTGWMILTLFSITQINAKHIELLTGLEQRMDKVEDKVDQVSNGLNKLEGEHAMMMRAGSMIRNHDFEKKT